MSARLPRLSGRTRSTAAIAVTAASLVVGVGFGTASAATATTQSANAATVKVAAKAPHARQRVVFLFHSKFAVGTKSRWSVAFGDHYVVSGKGRAPAKVWHVFSASGRYAVRFTLVDAKGKTHQANVVVAVAKALPGVSAPLGASGVIGAGGATSTTLNGVVVATTQPTPAASSVSIPVTVPSTTVPATVAPTTVAPATTSPVVIPTVIPTTIPTVIPTSIVPSSIIPSSIIPSSIIPTTTPSVSIPPVVAPVVNLLLGLNVSGLLHGQVLNFTTSTVQGSSAIATWAVNWGDGTTSTGTGTAPTALTHTYSGIGTHTARLTETATDGASGLSSNLLFVTV